jgi:hypothetical protein
MAHRGIETERQIISPFAHERLGQAVEIAREIYSSRQEAERFRSFAEDVAVDLMENTSARYVFGVGFPFYLLSDTLPARYQLNEYDSFLAHTNTRLNGDKTEKNEHGWPCPHCQEAGDLPDLKVLCKPCDQVLFKPRDIFKALPDIDLCVIVNPLDGDTLAEMSDFMEDRQFVVSDRSIRLAVNSFVDGYAEQDPKKFIMLDIHLLDANKVANGFQQVEQGNFDVPVPMFSYRGDRKWTDVERLPLGWDYLMSFTPLGSKDGKQQIPFVPAGINGPDDWVKRTEELAKQLGKKEARMFADPSDRSIIVPAIRQRVSPAFAG